MFWKRKDSDDEGEPTAVDDVPGDLAPVRIFTVDTIIEAWIDLPGGQRLSDILNVEELLSVSRVPRDPTASHWFVLERDQMLLVVPPPHISDRTARLHRVKRRILVHSGDYEVKGMVHMIAGIGLDPYLARSRQHFLPLTDAWVTSTEQTEVNEQHPALLVNVRSTTQRLQLQVLE